MFNPSYPRASETDLYGLRVAARTLGISESKIAQAIDNHWLITHTGRNGQPLVRLEDVLRAMGNYVGPWWCA